MYVSITESGVELFSHMHMDGLDLFVSLFWFGINFSAVCFVIGSIHCLGLEREFAHLCPWLCIHVCMCNGFSLFFICFSTLFMEILDINYI